MLCKLTCRESSLSSIGDLMNRLEISYSHQELLKYRISGSHPGQFPFQRNIRTHEPSSRRREAAIAGPFQLDGATLLWPSRTVREQPGGATGRNGGRREERHVPAAGF